jgi:septin family protein
MAGSEGARRALRRRVRAEERLLLVVAGPNGAGKSTFVESFLKSTGILVVNPDEVAKGLSPDTPEAIAYEAARVADTWRRDLMARGVSFCMETVFSDPHGAQARLREEDTEDTGARRDARARSVPRPAEEASRRCQEKVT